MASGEAEAEEIFTSYVPNNAPGGAHAHPDIVVEATSLSFVSPPPLRHHFLMLDHARVNQVVLNEGGLSDLQLELIGHALQQTERRLENGARMAFFNGDGAGVGKGRMIAGMILENILKGVKRAVWVSVSADLVEDAKRDLRDVGALVDEIGTVGGIPVKVTSLNKCGYGTLADKPDYVEEGVLFVTYSGLVAKERGNNGSISVARTRLDQVLELHNCVT